MGLSKEILARHQAHRARTARAQTPLQDLFGEDDAKGARAAGPQDRERSSVWQGRATFAAPQAPTLSFCCERMKCHAVGGRRRTNDRPKDSQGLSCVLRPSRRAPKKSPARLLADQDDGVRATARWQSENSRGLDRPDNAGMSGRCFVLRCRCNRAARLGEGARLMMGPGLFVIGTCRSERASRA
jgi:hypothetical protein